MVIVLLANGFEELEAITPVDVLRRHDIDVRTVSVTGEKLITSTHGIQIAADLLSSDVPLDQVKLLILPGGMPGVKNLDASPVTQSFIDATLRNGGHLAAICAGPSIFGKHGMLTNIRATCFPGFEAEMHNAILTDADVVTDGVFTTARNYRSATAFADELVRICEKLDIKPKNEDETPTDSDSEVNLTLDKLDNLFNVIKNDEATKAMETTTEKNDFSSYLAPSVNLLKADEKSEDSTDEVAQNANKIIEVLDSFGVKAVITDIDAGPRIIRYHLVPDKGVKVTAITNLFYDLAYNIGLEGIRMEAPIHGKSEIGIEVPRKNPSVVRVRELIDSEEFKNATSKTTVVIGKDVAGNPVYGDVAKFPHTLVCGATGMGKSVFINSMLASLLYKSRPDELKLILIDPKKVEFRAYIGIPHLLVPVITEADEAAGALNWAIEEMERRYCLLEKAGMRNVDAYNKQIEDDHSLGDILPKIVIVIDELADLMMMVRDPVEDLIMRIAQKARAAGIHLIIGTQRPSVQILTGVIKANIPTRISCKVTSQVDSRTIFDMGGAEKLLNRGDMLYWPVGQVRPSRVQCAFISDGEVEEITSFLRNQYPNYTHDSVAIDKINSFATRIRDARGRRNKYIEDREESCTNDQKFLEAVEIAISFGKVSTSLIQRKLSIGYGKAAKFIDTMEAMGIVSEPNGQKPREVLITLEEWREKLAKTDLD